MTFHDLVTPARACGSCKREGLCFARGFASDWGLLLKSIQPDLYWQMTVYLSGTVLPMNLMTASTGLIHLSDGGTEVGRG